MNELNYLYSIRPKNVLNIARGDKTYELRTKLPREMKEAIDKGEKVVMWIYCTKGKPYLNDYKPLQDFLDSNITNDIVKYNHGQRFNTVTYIDHFPCITLNGLVVAKCVVDGYEEIELHRIDNSTEDYDEYLQTETMNTEELCNHACVSEHELEEYLPNAKGYALHITQVEILDKPMEIGEFTTTAIPDNAIIEKNGDGGMPYFYPKERPSWHFYFSYLTRAPQSYQKVKAPEGKE